MGLTSFDNLGDLVETNRLNYRQYLRGLDNMAGIQMMRYDESEQCNYQYVVLEIDEAVAGINRDDLQRVLWAENVLARRYFYPGCHRLEPYRSNQMYESARLPQTERLAARVLSLPTGTSIGPDEVDGVCELIRFAISRSSELSARLPVTAVAPSCADTQASVATSVLAAVQREPAAA